MLPPLIFAMWPAGGLAAAAWQQCVQEVDPATLISLHSKAGDLPVFESGNLAVIDFAGDYARGLTPPRQRIAESYFREFGAVDFLIVFTTFEFQTGDARAFYNAIRNDVAGIGQASFNLSEFFGSASLQGYVDMAATSRWELNPRLPAFAFHQLADFNF